MAEISDQQVSILFDIGSKTPVDPKGPKRADIESLLAAGYLVASDESDASIVAYGRDPV